MSLPFTRLEADKFPKPTDFFLYLFFFHDDLGFRRQQGNGDAASFTPRYHFHQFYKHLDY